MLKRTLLILIFTAGLAALSNASCNGQTSKDQRLETAWGDCLKRNTCELDLESVAALARHGGFKLLLDAYVKARSEQKEVIVKGVFYSNVEKGEPSAVAFMKRIAFTPSRGFQSSSARWYALQFLAGSCDQRALAVLQSHGGTVSSPYQFEVECREWANTLQAFGACKYRPAKDVLANSLDSSCLDVANAAADSLKSIFPGECTVATTPQRARACYNELPSRIRH